MKVRNKNYKNNPLLVIVTIVLATTTIGLVINFFYGAFNEKRTSFSSYIESCETSTEADDAKKDVSVTENTTTRTYRFFGMNTESAPDMYTALKLNSDGKYIFYINNCEGVTKYIGEYTETNNVVRLTGEMTLDLEKTENGTILKFDLEKAGVCHDSGGSFSLEDSIYTENEQKKTAETTVTPEN